MYLLFNTEMTHPSEVTVKRLWRVGKKSLQERDLLDIPEQCVEQKWLLSKSVLRNLVQIYRRGSQDGERILITKCATDGSNVCNGIRY